MSPHCDHNLLSRYLDFELSLPERREVDQHLDSCVECRKEFYSLEHVDGVLSTYGRTVSPIPRDLESRILVSVDKPRHRLRLASINSMMPAALGSSVAAVLVLMSANLGLYQNPAHGSPRPTHTSKHMYVVKQSRVLVDARRSSAITSGNSQSISANQIVRHASAGLD